MKEIKIKKKKSLIKKILIKLNRIFGFEIIDQSNYSVVSLDKYGYENLSKEGVSSITLPLGKLEIKRPVKSLHIILRSCASVKMLTQSKNRIFDKEKYEYSIRTLNSLVKSLNFSKEMLSKIKVKLTIVDHNSEDNVIQKYNKILNNQFFENEIINLEFEKYKSSIENINEENKTVTENQKSNMANINQSLNIAKKSEDLIYFVEDDYIHKPNSLAEMLFAYEKFSSVFKKEIFILSTDYPYLYKTVSNSNILIGENIHWRTVNESLLTFMTSKKMIEKHLDKLIDMATNESNPFEKNLHKIYEKELCFSPIPSLSLHLTNINSVFGLSPNVNLKKLWDENK